MATAEVAILVRAKDEASKTFNQVNSNASKLQKTLGTGLRTAALAGTAGLAGLTYAVAGFVKQAAEEEVGIKRLETAIATLDEAHRGNAAEVEKVVRSRERLAFSDDEIRESLAKLIPATGDFDEALKRQSIAMDVARGTGLDLATTSRLLGKVTDESVNVFGRYGIVLKNGMSETEALAEVQRRFAGQSEAFAQTAAGKWALFGNQMDNIKESIGSALLPTVTQLGGALSEFLLRHQEDIDRFAQALAVKIPEGIEAIKQGFEGMRPTVESVLGTMRQGLERIQPALAWIIDNKVAMIAAITAIGLAFIIAFTPVTAPILAVTAALGALLFLMGTSKADWQNYSRTVDTAWVDITASIERELGIIGQALVSNLELDRIYAEAGFKAIRDIVVIVGALMNGDWMKAWDGIKKITVDAVDVVLAIIRNRMGVVRDNVLFAVAVIQTVWKTWWDSMRLLAGQGMLAVQSAILTIWEEIRKFFADLPLNITNAIGDLHGVLYEFAKHAVQGFIDGILDKIGAVGDAARGIGGAIADGVGSFLGINSPSTVMMGLGLDAMAGLQVGIEQGSSGIFATLDRILAEVGNRVQEISNKASTGTAVSAKRRQPTAELYSDAEKRFINEIARQRGEPLKFPGYRFGTPYVPQTGLAMLHQGEAVIPARENKRETEAGGMTNYGTVQIILPNVTQPQDFARELDRYMRGA